MAFKRLSPVAQYVDRGYGQVEPNHLSAQRTKEIYAQLPADKDIKVLENGQFVKYDYAKGVVDFTGKGEWMLVYNEIKVYRDRDMDEDFAMTRENYNARVYSPVSNDDYNAGFTVGKANGERAEEYAEINKQRADRGLDPIYAEGSEYTQYNWDVKSMPAGTIMVPRVFKTHEGDIFTTNTIKEAVGEIAVGDTLAPGADGYLTKTTSQDGMLWQVVKVYNMPSMQHGVKLMRIQ
jgi:hypothetical protein